MLGGGRGCIMLGGMKEYYEDFLGAPLDDADVLWLLHYVDLGFEEEILELIGELAQKYPDPERAEVVFVRLYQLAARRF
jgi:hypothetical protein